MTINSIRSALQNRILIALTASVCTFGGTVYSLAERSFEQYIIDANRETLESVMREIIAISLSMPLHTTQHGLATARNDDEIIERVERWVKGGNSARTGSLKTLCEHKDDALLQIMQERTAKTVCRMVN